MTETDIEQYIIQLDIDIENRKRRSRRKTALRKEMLKMGYKGTSTNVANIAETISHNGA